MIPPIYHPLTGSQVTALPALPWRVKGILPQQGLATIFGPPSSGKSFLAIDLAAAIALGNDWFGFRVKQSPVYYIALEGEGGIRKRVLAWEQANECKLPDNLFFIFGQFDITDALHVKQLASVIKRGSTVFIDTLSRAAGGKDENSPEGMGAILAGSKQLQTFTDCLQVFVHHTGKDVTKGMRGHSALHGAVDAAIEVIRDDSDQRSWLLEKSKDDADGKGFQFTLDIQQLGVDEDGDPVTSCAIQALELVPVLKPNKLKNNEKLVLDAIYASLQACPLLTRDDAFELAKKALSHVDSQHRSGRALGAVNSLIKKHKLVLDSDTQLITLAS